MTLIVSVRTADGIVLAGDSLATFSLPRDLPGNVTTTCTNCGSAVSAPGTLVGASVSSTTLPYAQKIAPLWGTFGVGTYGMAQIQGMTVSLAVRRFERTKTQAFASRLSPAQVAAELGEYFKDLIVKDLEAIREINPDFVFNDDVRPLGLQIVGYDGSMPTAQSVQVGTDVVHTSETGLNWFCTGELAVVNKLNDLYASDPSTMPLISGFSLQNAIEYAEFLITTTAGHQRFSTRMPTVGGDIDIAVVTPIDGFVWVKQKELYRKLEANGR